MWTKSLLIFFAIILSLSTHEQRATSNEQPALSGPDIFFEANRFDFGKIVEGEKAEHLFKYENRGNDTLIIQQVKTTCGCTAANTDLTEIEPGESGVLRVTYTASNKTGTFDKIVIVISNDPDKPHYVLKIHGEVVSEVIADPKYIDFGLIPLGKSSSKSVKLSKGYDAQSFTKGWVTGIESDTPLVTASYKENGNDEYIIEATLKSPPKGEQASKIQGNIFVLTQGLKQSRIELPFYGEVCGDVTVFPPVLHYGQILQGKEAARIVHITLRNKNVTIEKIEVGSDFLSVELLPKSTPEKPYREIQIKLKKDAPVGKMEGVVKVHTNSEIQPVTEIPVTWEVEKREWEK